MWSGYHRRSLVESKMNGIQRLGKRVMSRTFERQVHGLHIRAAILKRFTALGRPQTVATAGVGVTRRKLDLCNNAHGGRLESLGHIPPAQAEANYWR